MSDIQQSPMTPSNPPGSPWAPSPEPARRRRRVGTVALVAGGLVAGGVLGGALSATAAAGGTANGASGVATEAPSVDESRPQRPDETLLTGDTADKVEAAALAEYPDATVLRVETDSDGVYEAHLVTAAGERVTVEVGEDFTVTGVEARAGRDGGPGGHRVGAPGGRRGGSDSAPDGAPTPDGSSGSDSTPGASESALTL